jgi:plastocyanin
MRFLHVVGPSLVLACVDFGVIPPPEPDLPPPPEGGLPSGDGGSDGAGGDCDVEVVLQFLAFSPKEVTIAPGDTVCWTNLDAVVHTVTEGGPVPRDPRPYESGREWRSAFLGQGDEFLWTFTAAGDWTYLCETHANVMYDNKVHVR